MTEAPAVGADVVQPLPADVYPKPTITLSGGASASAVPCVGHSNDKGKHGKRAEYECTREMAGLLKQETDGVRDTPKDASSGNYNLCVGKLSRRRSTML